MMRFENINIALVPRKASSCLDLAIRFYGRFLIPILKLWAVIAIPTCTLVYCLSYYFLLDLRTALTIAFFASSPMGVLLTWNSALFTFGNTQGIGSLRRQFRFQMIPLMLRCLFDRALFFVGPALLFFSGNILSLLGFVYIFFPGTLFLIRNGFRVEQAVLDYAGVASQQDASHDHRTKDLISNNFSSLFGRGLAAFLFCYTLTFILFITFDYLCYILLEFPILIGQIPYLLDPKTIDESLVNIMLLMTTDPRVLTVLTAFILLVYPIGRLTWFFTYIDLRVRLDCWDMELRMTEVSENLTFKEVSL
ncbi:hypothetical protein [Gimesia panareensis]|uniref:hypothetical protein n=1 Tax=Gimesia panareensis TaxID=2527978 RepID=UPI00118CDB3C|nr:hypothetical protein [Gimesia panareensis]QDU53200.1 hypothetical protein Pan110_55850 [Gimesia panareensis]